MENEASNGHSGIAVSQLEFGFCEINEGGDGIAIVRQRATDKLNHLISCSRLVSQSVHV